MAHSAQSAQHNNHGLASMNVPPLPKERITSGICTTDDQMQNLLRCTARELEDLKRIVKNYMQRPEYDGKPLVWGDYIRWDDEKKIRMRRALWERVASHDNACREMLSGARWSEAEIPQNFSKHLDTVKIKIMRIPESAVTLSKEPVAGSIPGRPIQNKVSGNSATSEIGPGLARKEYGGPMEDEPVKKRRKPARLPDTSDEDDEEIVSRKASSVKRQKTVNASAPDYVMSGAVQTSPSTETEPGVTVRARAPASVTSSTTSASSPGAGASFNEQMLLLTMQNQQMMLSMMKEIQELKKGGQ